MVAAGAPTRRGTARRATAATVGRPNSDHPRATTEASDLAFGRFRLLEPIGHGGTAEVWRARDERLGRDVALKRLHPSFRLDDEDRRRLIDEARAVAALAHPNTVTVYDVVADASGTALVLELVQGRTLAELLAEGDRPDPEEALDLLAGVAAALDAAHGIGIVHRDVKPGNVIVDDAGRVRLVDFGIASAMDEATDGSDGAILGTPPYMAPEQLAGGPISPAIDVYALGVVAYELLSGRPPFGGASDLQLLERAQRRGSAPIPGLPLAANEVLARALAVTPADRPSAGEFVASLRAAVWSEDAPYVVASAGGGTLGAPAAEADAPPPSGPVAAEPSSSAPTLHRQVATGALGLALTILAGGALLGAAVGTDRPASPTRVIAGAAAPSRATPRPVASHAATPRPAPKAGPGDGGGHGKAKAHHGHGKGGG